MNKEDRLIRMSEILNEAADILDEDASSKASNIIKKNIDKIGSGGDAKRYFKGQMSKEEGKSYHDEALADIRKLEEDIKEIPAETKGRKFLDILTAKHIRDDFKVHTKTHKLVNNIAIAAGFTAGGVGTTAAGVALDKRNVKVASEIQKDLDRREASISAMRTGINKIQYMSSEEKAEIIEKAEKLFAETGDNRYKIFANKVRRYNDRAFAEDTYAVRNARDQLNYERDAFRRASEEANNGSASLIMTGATIATLAGIALTLLSLGKYRKDEITKDKEANYSKASAERALSKMRQIISHTYQQYYAH